MKPIALLFLLFLLGNCGPGPKEKISIYHIYKFDKQVIDKLPVYDSLVVAILENAPSLHSNMKEKDSYRSYRYMLYSDSTELFKKLTAEQAGKINRYFMQLGKNFFYGFDLFKDSSIKIYIRSSISEKDQVEIKENLSYYPPGTKMSRREFPAKDTILNKNWQYWIAFDERELF
ncbi:MAG: hypothetical protein ABIN36_00485 [Ferruginibacter sp.]